MRKSAQRLASTYVNFPALRPGAIGAYSFALICAGAAAALQIAIDPYLAGAHYITFFLAVVATTLIGGFGAGLFCLALSAAAVDFFLFQPPFSFFVDLVEVPSLLLFTLAGLFCVVIITGMRSAVEHKHLQVSKAHLQLALDTARLGWWRCDLIRQVVWGDPRFKEIFDLTHDEMPADHIKNLVHSDDAERFWADREASLDPADPGWTPEESRVQRRDGEVRWVEVRRKPPAFA
jgi:PAS domain S-box-containing protein